MNPRWVTGAGWLPIGINEHQPFVATFNGNSHVIANLYIHRTTAHGSPWSSGLFSVIGGSSIIREVSILNAQIAAVGSIGPLVGWNLRGIIRDCQASGRVRVTTADHQGRFNVGGLVGDNYDQGTIINSRAKTAVIGVGAEATDSMGGLVGRNWGSISNSYATGQVSGAFIAGGLVGDNSGYHQQQLCHGAGLSNIQRRRAGRIQSRLHQQQLRHGTGLRIIRRRAGRRQ